MSEILSMPRAAQMILAASLLALAFALTLQYGFGVQPCVLCLWQRAPYGAAAGAALLAWLWRPGPHVAAFLLFSCAACFLTGFGLAIFHSGVELHWWLGTSGCSIHPLNGASADDLRNELLQTLPARCDQITWTLAGLSMANLNIGLSLLLAFFSTAAAAKALDK
ncbi:MAG: disulfide bond formation protein B [Alphaproteobacteria bacterium]|nr:disulfide bond formation protein B [Alphaproteobacteria bacterium]